MFLTLSSSQDLVEGLLPLKQTCDCGQRRFDPIEDEKVQPPAFSEHCHAVNRRRKNNSVCPHLPRDGLSVLCRFLLVRDVLIDTSETT